MERLTVEMAPVVGGPLDGTRMPWESRARVIHRPDGIELWYSSVSEPVWENGFYYGRRRYYSFMGFHRRGVSLASQARHDREAAALLLVLESGGSASPPPS